MKDISPSQKKMVGIAAVVMLLAVLTGVFIYAPTLRKVGLLKNELMVAQNQIEQIEAAVGGGPSIAEGIKLLKDRHSKLDMKFPSREEEALRLVSEFARARGISIISMKSRPKTEFLDVENKSVGMEEKICRILPVSIELTSSYKDLGQYIEILNESLPAYVTIEKLKIRKESGTASDLRIILELNLYLLS